MAWFGGWLGPVVACLGLAPSGAPAVSPGEFQEWFDAARDGRLDVPRAVARAASGYRYVFVGGLKARERAGFFEQNIRRLRRLGVPAGSIHVVHTSPHRTVQGNADEVSARFRAIADEGPEPLVVVAHSRGACDALAFALAHPEFVRTRVAALFCVQGAFGGSLLADFVSGDGPPLDRRVPPLHRAWGRLVAMWEAYRLSQGVDAGLVGLTRSASRDLWREALDRDPGAAELVGRKVFYLTSAVPPKRLRFVQRAGAWYLGVHEGPNDGLVAMKDQTVAGLGTVVAVLDVGHQDLVQGFPAARGGRKLRGALADCVVMAVGSDAASGRGEPVRPSRKHRR